MALVHYDRSMQQRAWLQQMLCTLHPGDEQPPMKDWDAIMLMERATRKVHAMVFYTYDDIQCGHLLMRAVHANYDHVTQGDVQAMLCALIEKHGVLKHMHIARGHHKPLIPWLNVYGFREDGWPVFDSSHMRQAGQLQAN